MGNPFTSATISSYNANPPADDGSQIASNRVQWATHKAKLSDPIKTAVEADISNTNSAFAKVVGGAGITSTGSDYSVSASDQSKLIKVTASATITTPDAATVDSPFVFALVNLHTGNITFAGYDTQTIDGSASITIPSGNGLFCYTDGSNWFTTGQNFTKSFPPPSTFKNMSIKVTGNTGVDLAADYITVTDGSKFQTLAFSTSINMASTGAAALDTGSIAQATWYAIWAIAKDDGTTSAIASTSASSPTMPTDYTYKARVGWVRTAAAAAQLLGTWQFGRRATYIIGLAQTTETPLMGSSTAGTVDNTSPTLTSLSTSSVVPTTAYSIEVAAFTAYKGGSTSNIIVAPSSAYSGTNKGPSGSGGILPPIYLGASSLVVCKSIVLESSNLYWASSAAGGAVCCIGWEDNL